jgi:hypothetical protein
MNLISAMITTGDTATYQRKGITLKFISDAHRYEWKWLLNYIEEHGRTPSEEVMTRAFPNSFVMQPVDDVAYYCDAVIREFKRERMAKLFNKVYDLLAENEPDDAIAACTTEIAKLSIEVPGAGAQARPVMHDSAFYGLAGDFVDAVDPHTEADRVALLLAFLTSFGNLVGPEPHAVVSATEHHPRLFSVLVGTSSHARKGTAQALVNDIFKRADRNWYEHAMISGISSGEGIIAAVKDDDEGPTDKRILFLETEFGRVLTVGNRDGSTASHVMRQAWDGDPLGTVTKKESIRARSGGHISIMGHITADELKRKLNDVDLVNGFVNRFLFALVSRSKYLPHGDMIDHHILDGIARRVEKAAARAGEIQMMLRTPDARALWESIYSTFDTGDDPAGAVASRGEAQTTRLSVIYALLDESATVERHHLQAAFAVWRYCEASVRMLFTGAMPKDADKLLAAIRQAGAEGLTLTQQHDVFARNISVKDLGKLRVGLERQGLVRTVTEKTGGPGRPKVVSYAAGTK